MKNNKIRVENLGIIDYQSAWDYQEKIFQATIAIKISNRDRHTENALETPNYLIFCEHPHVYTLGKSGKEGNLLASESDLIAKQATYYRTNRGGDITYHGYGQLVVYPILDLDNFYTDVHRYMRDLEEVVILTLADFGIAARRVKGLTGVWLGEENNPRKICAMGVKMSRWVSMHGLALNVSTDLSYFGQIIPCGITDKGVTSMEKELVRKISLEEVSEIMLKHFIKVFGFTLS